MQVAWVLSDQGELLFYYYYYLLFLFLFYHFQGGIETCLLLALHIAFSPENHFLTILWGGPLIIELFWVLLFFKSSSTHIKSIFNYIFYLNQITAALLHVPTNLHHVKTIPCALVHMWLTTKMSSCVLSYSVVKRFKEPISQWKFYEISNSNLVNLMWLYICCS